MRFLLSCAIVCACCAVSIPGASSLSAKDIPTTYGEDPVPDPYRSLSPPFTAYGMDPIPTVSPLERWLMLKHQREQRLSERGIETAPRQRPGLLERIHWPWYSKR